MYILKPQSYVPVDKVLIACVELEKPPTNVGKSFLRLFLTNIIVFVDSFGHLFWILLNDFIFRLQL